MDSGVVKNLLINYRFYVLNLQTLDEKIKLLEEELDGLKGQDYSTEKVQSDGKNLLEERVVKIADLKLKRENERVRVQAIEKAVEELEDLDKQIIKLKYINKNSSGVTWAHVAKQVGYSEDHCRKRGIEALKKISIVVNWVT